MKYNFLKICVYQNGKGFLWYDVVIDGFYQEMVFDLKEVYVGIFVLYYLGVLGCLAICYLLVFCYDVIVVVF